MAGDSAELPGGDVPDTGDAGPRLGGETLAPLPGGEVKDTTDRFELVSQSRRLLVQEVVRAGLAMSLLVLLAIVIVLGFGKVGTTDWAKAKEFLDVIIPALIALLGSAMGFYFGSRR